MLAFRRHPDGARMATGLRDRLIALDAAQLAYKGLTAHRDRLAEALERIAAGAWGASEGPGVDDVDACGFEMRDVARCDGGAVRKADRGDLDIERLHAAPLAL